MLTIHISGCTNSKSMTGKMKHIGVCVCVCEGQE